MNPSPNRRCLISQVSSIEQKQKLLTDAVREEALKPKAKNTTVDSVWSQISFARGLFETMNSKVQS